jgi:hypothetical protein
LPDPHAWIPLIAHIQHWTGDLHADLLKDALLGIPFHRDALASELSQANLQNNPRPLSAPANPGRHLEKFPREAAGNF